MFAAMVLMFAAAMTSKRSGAAFCQAQLRAGVGCSMPNLEVDTVHVRAHGRHRHAKTSGVVLLDLVPAVAKSM